jgi:hypothetical protein
VFNYAGEDEPKFDSLAVCHKPTKTNYKYQCSQSGGTSNALNAVRVNPFKPSFESSSTTWFTKGHRCSVDGRGELVVEYKFHSLVRPVGEQEATDL